MSSRLMRTVGFLLLSAFVVLKPSLGHAEDAPSWETVLEAERLRLVSDAIQRLHPGATREQAITRLRAQGLMPRGIKDSLLLRVLHEWTFKVGVGASVRDEFRRGDRLSDLHAYTGTLVRVQLLFDDGGVIKGKSWAVGSHVAVVMPHHARGPRSAAPFTFTGETDAPVVESPGWIGVRKPRAGAEADFVRVAKALDFLDWGDVVYGRDLEVRPPARNRIERNQVVLSWLLSVPHPVADLVTLSRHEHPRIRTLALVALLETESPHALPAIVARLDDDAPTLGRHAHWSITLGMDYVKTFPLEKTTVGDVAGGFLDSWLAKAGTRTPREGWMRYWAQRKHRPHCVGWMAVRLYRRLRGSPIPEAQYPKIRALYKEALLLPPVDRDLTILAVFSKSDVSSLVGREEVLAAGPRLGLDRLRALARGEVITEDPDFQLDARGRSSDYQQRVRWLILQNADTWLRPSDADMVLKMGRGMRSPLGAVKAGNLAPERAKALLESAWEESATGPFKAPNKRFEILKGMWEQIGKPKGDLIIDWYYREYEAGFSGSTPIHDLPPYLLDRGTKRDVRLLKRLILDERFEQVSHEMTIIYLVLALNHFLDTKLGGVEQIHGSNVRGEESHWREVMRKTMRLHPRFRDL